ncbi:MAG: DJ-1/PfpI family protein [Candidatus Aminicenantales bacterium]
MKIAIFVFPGLEELDFVGVFEVLAKAEEMRKEGMLDAHESIEIEIVSFEQEIVCAHDMVIKAHRIYDGLENYDVLIIPGGRGIHSLKDNRGFLKDIEEFARERLIASVCTGSFVLAWAGLLSGKKATTHHLHSKDLEGFCQVIPERIVVDGNVITAGGISSSIDLGLRMLEIFFDENIAEQVAARIEYSLQERKKK